MLPMNNNIDSSMHCGFSGKRFHGMIKKVEAFKHVSHFAYPLCGLTKKCSEK
jgi:hypothetical protein